MRALLMRPASGVGNRKVVHGGVGGAPGRPLKLLSDTQVLLCVRENGNVESCTWEWHKIDVNGEIPSARRSHAIAASDSNMLFLYGERSHHLVSRNATLTIRGEPEPKRKSMKSQAHANCLLFAPTCSCLQISTQEGSPREWKDVDYRQERQGQPV